MTRVGSAALALVATMAFCSTAAAAPPWSAPSVLGPTGREVGPPEIAIAPDGEAIAAWEGGKPNGIQVSTRKPGGDWTPPVLLAKASESEGPHIAVSASKAVIVWRGTVRGHGSETSVVMAATRLRGKGWGKPQNISKEKRWREEPEGSAPQVTITRSGKVTAIWTAGDERHVATSFVRSATQSAKGSDWSVPVALPGSIPGEEAQIGTTPGGEAVAIWGAAYNEESGIEVSSRPAHGKWKRAGRLGFPGPFPHPQLGITSTGEAVGVWLEEPESGRAAVLKVATRPPGGKWKVTALAPTSYSASPSIVTEPGGRVKLVWAIFGPSGTTAEVVSSTHLPGDAWTAPVSLAAEGLQLPQGADPRIAVTSGGESIAVWTAEGQTGEDSIVQEARKAAGGTWSAPIKISVSHPAPKSGSISDLQLKVTPSGEAVAIWSGFDGTERVIEAATRPAGLTDGRAAHARWSRATAEPGTRPKG
jgi:hypothetical protein